MCAACLRMTCRCYALLVQFLVTKVFQISWKHLQLHVGIVIIPKAILISDQARMKFTKGYVCIFPECLASFNQTDLPY